VQPTSPIAKRPRKVSPIQHQCEHLNLDNERPHGKRWNRFVSYYQSGPKQTSKMGKSLFDELQAGFRVISRYMPGRSVRLISASIARADNAEAQGSKKKHPPPKWE